MKTEIKDSTINQDLKYPKLMRGIHSEIVIYFTKAGVGTVVYPLSYPQFMEMHSDWSLIGFTDFTGELTIKN